MSLDIAVLHEQIIEAAVIAVNGTAEKTAERAKDYAPVRKVFAGGRQTVRFKTASEIEGDRALRAKLGLGPEKLASKEAARALIRSGANPKGGKRFAQYTLPGGEPGGIEEYRFASTVELGRHDGRAPRLGENRANAVGKVGPRKRSLVGTSNLRTVGVISGVKGRHTGLDLSQLSHEGAEARLTARGRYELRSGRALSAIAFVKGIGTVGTHKDDTATLGGSLRESIRVIRASAEQFPVISASVVAGGGRVTYAKYQELGTRHNPAHPFLRPALAVAEDELPGDLERALRRTLGGSRR